MADMRWRSPEFPRTGNVKVYVIGFGVGASVQAGLNAIAAAGGTGRRISPPTAPS